MANDLTGKRIAVLVANGFEQSEMTKPKKALEDAGAVVDIISPEKEVVKGWKHTSWGDEFTIDIPLAQANPQDYDALLLPGGVMNPDKLRLDNQAIDFIQKMFNANKPIAAICHGPWTLINANAVKGYKMTSWPSIKLDLVNAGAEWVDEECVIDRGLVTSRNPNDIPAFNKGMIQVFSLHEGKNTKSSSTKEKTQ